MSLSPSSTVGRSRALPITTTIALIGSFLLSALTALTIASPVDAAAVEAGYIDHSWSGSTVNGPTQDKPQSKVWYADGFWWGGLFVDGDHRIHRYNAGNHTWADTGVVIDDRNRSHGDYLWDGSSLYVASVNNESAADPILVFKLNYSASTDTYSHDPAFGPGGVQVGTGPSETVTIAKDSTGQLWVTFQSPGPDGREIMVNRSTSNEHTWGEPFSIGSASGDDISAIIAFGGDSIGVMWSDQNPAETQTFFYFSIHADSDADDAEWTTKQSSAQGTDDFAEDHINLKLVATNSGEVLAAVKTNGGPDHIQVLRRSASTGNWTKHVVVGDGQSATRPQIVVDSTNSRAYVFYTVPESEEDPSADQAIYYKSAPLDTLNFTTSGIGTAFIKDGTNDINDVSTAKHPVTSAMGGILAIASSDTNERYYHGWLSLTGGGAESPFDDVPPTHKFYEDIIYIWEQGITTGCTSNLFCPQGDVNRQQMAAFLSRALELPPASDDYFDDDETSPHEDHINRLFESGITVGCGDPEDRTFCPKDLVNRGMMATFLTRAYELPATDIDYFTDDNNIVHEPNINALRESGITQGCGPTTFCPKDIVNRQQMAAFLHRAETQ